MKLSNYKTSLLIMLAIGSVTLAACTTTPVTTPTPAPSNKCKDLTNEIDKMISDAKTKCKDDPNSNVCKTDISNINDKIKTYNENGCQPHKNEVKIDDIK